MFDSKLVKQLETMLNQMTPQQKEKLSKIMQDENSLKNAISGIDPKKAQQVMESLGQDAKKKK